VRQLVEKLAAEPSGGHLKRYLEEWDRLRSRLADWRRTPGT
jgi:hypothetical protein